MDYFYDLLRNDKVMVVWTVNGGTEIFQILLKYLVLKMNKCLIGLE